MKLASIDLGTNTCNLSIADWSAQNTEILFSEKQAIKLGAEGFKNGNISDAAVQRVLNALHHYKSIIENYNVIDTQVFATSGLRNAANQETILNRIKRETGYSINLISGDQEAEFIYQGVRQAVPMDERPFVLLDIGGGSNEIQIASMDKVLWRKSYDLGIARLLVKFKTSDPLRPEEIQEIHTYLNEELQELKTIAEKFNPKVLIGSSGSFDTFASMYIHKAGLAESYKDVVWYQIPFDAWSEIYKDLTTSTQKERLEIPGMEAMRVEMIPLASVFTDFLINLFRIQELIRSAYALKEGVFQTMAGNLQNDH